MRDIVLHLTSGTWASSRKLNAANESGFMFEPCDIQAKMCADVNATLVRHVIHSKLCVNRQLLVNICNDSYM